MNRRNAACIGDCNERERFRIVDDKLRMFRLCRLIDVPSPPIFACIESHSQLRRLSQVLDGRTEFVIKPNRGSSGRGIMVIVGRDQNRFLRHNGERLDLDDLRQHISDIMSGIFSLGGRPDSALVQYRVQLHRVFAPIAFKGIPDLRVLLYRNNPAMAMLRLPTRASNGRANLHQGGIGVGINLATGRTHHAVQCDESIVVHPDTGNTLIGLDMPHWEDVMMLARRAAEAIGLRYVGVDIVIDRQHGPMLLEANARPGLGIQLANAQGLRSRLDAIDAELALSAAKLPQGQLA